MGLWQNQIQLETQQMKVIGWNLARESIGRELIRRTRPAFHDFESPFHFEGSGNHEIQLSTWRLAQSKQGVFGVTRWRSSGVPLNLKDGVEVT